MSDNTLHAHEMTNSHLLVQSFDYLEPRSVEEAVALMARYGDGARVIAGGTNVLVWMKMEQIAPRALINVGKLPDLRGIARSEGEVRIGAGTTIRELRYDPGVRAAGEALAEACAAFGSVQIQTMGTLGGNLCNGSPASDTVPALMVLEAELVLVGPDGRERRTPVADFPLGPGRTARRPGELLTSVHLPSLPDGAGSAFVKISRVAADLAKASVAAVVVREGDRVARCRLAYGSVGPTVLRGAEAEAVLSGRVFSPALALEAGAAAAEEIAPIDDVRSTAWYRREVIQAITHDVLLRAWERAVRAEAGAERAEKPPRAVASTSPGEGVHLPPDTVREIELTVNGRKRRLGVKSNDLLLNVLRERLELTGAKYGCGVGECGACTVHLNGRPALSCLTLAVAADGSAVTTVEGLQGPAGELSPLQEAFIEHGAFQCGYCTPGMLMMAQHLLNENPHPGEDEIRDRLKGNRCRCTGFVSIVRAIESCTRSEE